VDSPPPPTRNADGARPWRGAEIALALASLLVVPALALLAEGVLRAWDPDYLERVTTGALADLEVYSSTYGWTLRPGRQLVRGRTRITINSEGCRGPERGGDPARPVVLLLGDSIAFGMAVDDDETFAARLSAAGVEAVNMAVPGWGTDQELLDLQRRRLVAAPRMVVLSVCLENDFADNHSPVFFYDGVHPKPYFTLDGDGLVLHDAHVRSWRRGAAVWLRQSSHLYNRIAGVPAASHEGWPERMARALTPREEARAVTYRLVAEVARTARGMGAEALVLLHPNKDGFHAGSDLRDGFFDAPVLRGVDIVDMAAVYQARGMRWSQIALDAVGHLTPAGHAVVAETILDRLRGRTDGVVQRPGAARSR
jgi:hypothetical protein